MMKKKLIRYISWVAIFIMFSIQSPGECCTTILAGKRATVDGSVLNSHTCDGTGYRTWFDITSRKQPAQNVQCAVYENAAKKLSADALKQAKIVGTIPQVKTTYSFINTAYPCMNEYQLAFGESTFGGRKELRNPKGLIDCPELIRLALERAKTAREAISMIDTLTKKYGYNDSGEILTISDPHEVWLLEILGAGPHTIGAVWAAQRVPDGHVSVSANASRLRQLDLADTNNFRASTNVYALAKQNGWWSPDNGKPFEFCYAYAPEARTSMAGRRREWRVLSLLAPSQKLNPNDENFPFSVRPDTLISVRDIMRLFRDTYEDTEFDMTKYLVVADKKGNMVKSKYANPFMPYDMMPLFKINGGWGKKGERCLARWYCTYITVLQSRSWLANPIGGLVWFGYDNPAMTAYAPLYAGITEIPASYQIDGQLGFNSDCAWWAFNRVADLAAQRWGDMRVEVDSARIFWENKAFRQQPEVEAKAEIFFKEDPQKAIRFLNDYSNDFCRQVEKAYWKLGDDLWSKYTGKF